MSHSDSAVIAKSKNQEAPDVVLHLNVAGGHRPIGELVDIKSMLGARGDFPQGYIIVKSTIGQEWLSLSLAFGKLWID